MYLLVVLAGKYSLLPVTFCVFVIINDVFVFRIHMQKTLSSCYSIATISILIRHI